MADDGSGFGQQDPSDSVGETNPLLFFIEQQLAKVSTIKVVLVKAVDTDAKTVDVQPMVNQLDGNSRSTPHGTILGIPYWQWQFGKNKISADPVVGDIGIMACADRDISAVKATKAISNPGSDNRFAMADGIYFGGILNGDPDQEIKFTDTGMELHDKNSNSLVSSAAGWTFTGPVIFNQTVDVKGVATLEAALQLGGSIESVTGSLYGGDIHIGGTFTADTDLVYGAGGARVTLKSHIHPSNGAPPTPGH